MCCLRPRRPLWIAAWLTLPLAASSAAAPRTTPPAGLRENTPSTHAFLGGKLVIAPGKAIEGGTLLIRDGVIVAAGADVAVPPEARIWDCRGKTIYAGLIDAFGELSAEASKLGVSDKHGAGYWNSKVVPQVGADARYGSDEELNKKLRSQGIAARLAAPSAGIIKGTSALVAARDRPGAPSILKPRVAMH